MALWALVSLAFVPSVDAGMQERAARANVESHFKPASFPLRKLVKLSFLVLDDSVGFILHR